MNAFNRLELQAIHLHDAASFSEPDLLEVIMMQRFGTEYQPIIDLQSGEVEGYQASARFWGKDGGIVDAEEVFAYLRRNPSLHLHTELQLKKLQIAQFPANAGWLMLDLDIDSLMQGGDTLDNPFLLVFREHAWTERELVINLAGQSAADPESLQCAIALLQQSGAALALKDMGASLSTFSLSSFLDASIIKLDRSVWRLMKQESAQAIVGWLVSAARRIGVQTVMSGINNCEQLEWARKLGVDNVQGRLFERQAMQARTA
jgi:EAL domain-containing protein (putative c-di-GMP-specific phosphodiesterase class I)